jgi:hypothetical protein
MNLDTPETNKLLGEILDAQGVLNDHNAPANWVKLARKLERERNRWRAIATRLAPYVEPDIWEGIDAHDAREDFEHESKPRQTP